MAELTIEHLSEKRIPEVAEMALELWPGCLYEEECANCLEILNSPGQAIWVARTDGHSIGFIQLSLRTDYVEGTTTSPVVYIEGLYVKPPFRHQGVANRLVREAEAWGLGQNCTEMASDAELNNRDSIDFHKAIGFREVNRVVCFSRSIGPCADT